MSYTAARPVCRPVARQRLTGVRVEYERNDPRHHVITTFLARPMERAGFREAIAHLDAIDAEETR